MPDDTIQRAEKPLKEEEEKIQMKTAGKGKAPKEEEELLQTKPIMMKSKGGESTATPALATQLNSTKGSGKSLAPDVNASMSNAFGTDFSHVRVHTDTRATQMNHDLHAKAFTHGSDIYFNQGQYAPTSSEGKRLLAHELTHVVQQGTTIQASIHKIKCKESIPISDKRAKISRNSASKTVIRCHATEDCDTNQKALIRSAISIADANLRSTIKQLKIRPLTKDTENLLWLYFRSYSQDTANTVADNLNSILSTMNSLTYECENDCSEFLEGYVRTGTMYTGIGNIHLCLNNLTNPNEIAEIIIHEIAHYSLLAKDKSYYNHDCKGNEATALQGNSVLISNADSYTCIVTNWINGNVEDRAYNYGDLSGENIVIYQKPTGTIDLNSTNRKVPMFRIKFIDTPPAKCRWSLRDMQNNAYKMTNLEGTSLQQFKPYSAESALAIINFPTRRLLQSYGIRTGRVLCRIKNARFNKLFEVPVTFTS